jgi:cell division protein FtsL
MVKLNVLLATMLITCSLLLVTSQHRARKGFIDLERAQAMARKHEVEWQQLLLDQTRLAKHSLIDAVARRDLKMQPVSPERTLYLNAPQTAQRSAGSPQSKAR